MYNQFLTEEISKREYQVSNRDKMIRYLQDEHKKRGVEILDLKDKLHKRNIMIKESKKKRIKADYIENLLHQWQATEKMDFNCNAGRRDLALYLAEIINR